MTTKHDEDAVEIGKLYRSSNVSLAESIKARLECGRLLLAKKASLRHGEWLPWLKANAQALGFKDRSVATRLMSFAADKPNVASTHHLSEEAAALWSRELWGNKNESEEARLNRQSNERCQKAREKERKKHLNQHSRQQADYLDAFKVFEKALRHAIVCRERFSPESMRFLAQRHERLKSLMDDLVELDAYANENTHPITRH